MLRLASRNKTEEAKKVDFRIPLLLANFIKSTYV